MAELWTTHDLPGIHWDPADEPDDWDDRLDDPRLHDLRGQGLTATQLHTIQDTVCTEPAGHYRRETDPHAGPLIVGGRQIGGAAWDEPTGEQP